MFQQCPPSCSGQNTKRLPHFSHIPPASHQPALEVGTLTVQAVPPDSHPCHRHSSGACFTMTPFPVSSFVPILRQSSKKLINLPFIIHDLWEEIHIQTNQEPLHSPERRRNRNCLHLYKAHSVGRIKKRSWERPGQRKKTSLTRFSINRV